MNNSIEENLNIEKIVHRNNVHEIFMRRCIQLARNGELTTSPNPMVGAVIVYNNRIIGEGYHHFAGQAHAEVNALHSIKEEDRKFISQSTLYVSLEPCSHFGRTPPCAQLIIKKGFKQVVVGCMDPFPRVSGKGIKIIKDAGIDIVVGVLEKECKELIKKFITFHLNKRPYITLKWAKSADGFIDKWRSLEYSDSEKQKLNPPVRLSTQFTQIAVHHLRSLHKAILVGHRTLLLDKPQLNVRAWHGPSPIPIVLGKVSEGELPFGWQCFADTSTLLDSLYQQGLDSLLIEGGLQTLQGFIDKGLWDEAWEELSTILLTEGVPAPKMPTGVKREIVYKFDRYFTHWINE